MSQFPDSTQPHFLNQLNVLLQMGYFLRIISLKALPVQKDLSEYSRLEEQSFSLKLTKRHIPQALLTLFLLGMIAPFKSFKAFGAMLKMLFRFKDRKQVIRNYLQAGILINQHVIDKEISHLHAHCEPNAARTTYLASLLTGLNSSYLTLPGEIFKPDFPLLKPALVHSVFIFTLSRYEEKVLIEKTFEDIELLPEIFHFLNGIDLEKFEFRRVLRIPREPYQLLTATCLTDKKGLDTIISALRQLKDKGLKFRYRVIGDGPALPKLEKLVKTLKLEREIIFYGVLPHYEMPRLLATSDLYVLAPGGQENGEQASLSLGIREAMASGVPVAATDSEAMRELLEPEETGLLVPANDPSAFASACQRLLSDNELRSQIILKARLKIEGSYDIHKQAQAFNDYIIGHNLPL
ncbi:MAG: glycosyltransferase [Victivallaceae bacterium]|nr:glycosyltransferase [Victivallaceae bacterium]